MNVEGFEQRARAAPDTVTLEFIDGELVAKPPRDGDHAEIVAWLCARFARILPSHWLYDGRRLRVGTALGGRVRPDGVLAPRGHFAGHGEWSEPDGVLMVVEVTSRVPNAAHRVRIAKRDGYAAAGVPVYLLIDRDSHSAVVHSAPHQGAYRQTTSVVVGEDVGLPAPVGVLLPTRGLADCTG